MSDLQIKFRKFSERESAHFSDRMTGLTPPPPYRRQGPANRNVTQVEPRVLVPVPLTCQNMHVLGTMNMSLPYPSRTITAYPVPSCPPPSHSTPS